MLACVSTHSALGAGLHLTTSNQKDSIHFVNFGLLLSSAVAELTDL